MASKWLSLFFKFSSWIFNLKQKMIKADKWYAAAFYALAIFIFELFIAIVSLPLYFIVSPKSLQEKGLVFPSSEKEPIHFKSYIVKRKISLVTIFGAGGIFIVKVAFVAIISFYLLGAQALLAATQNWTFDVEGDYTTSSANVEITGGVARLKDLGSTTSGNTTNSGFTTDATGWTGADWGAGGGEVNPTESRITTGGNIGAYINISAPAGSNDELGGYWRQPFTTTVDNPITSVSFDWLVTAYDSTPAPITFKLYVFVDTGSGTPTIGQQVWASSEITSTSGWASVSNLDVSSKVTTAGTYYLKVAMWVETPGSTSGPFTVGYDNVLLNWTKTTHLFDATKPTIRPNASLTMPKTVSWDSFSETATKNGGEIYYQLSSDDGSTWKYWTGSAWGTAGASNYNIASEVNTNISTFSTSSNKIMWKAFLSSDASQQVILDNIGVTYTENTPPVATSLVPAQNTSFGYVNVAYNLQDANSDPSSLVNYEYSLTGAFTGEQVTMTASSTDLVHSGTTNLTTSPTGIAKTFVWDAKSQLGAVYNTGVFVRLRGNDGIQNGIYTTSTAFTVDYVDPVISNVSATEVVGSSNVTISYDLTDNTTDNNTVELQISGDGGATWVVPATSVSGAIGSSVTAGVGNIITWNAGADYSGHQKSNMQVRLRAKDKWQNQGSYSSSSSFSLDTLNPATATATELQAQPLAGATTVLIGGSFTEVNPNLNDYFVAIDGGDYSASTTGDTNTATPSNKATSVGATLDGNDYISKVKIAHTDDYNNIGVNENSSPSVAFKFVKPYTPVAPSLSSPVTTRLDLQVNEASGEAGDLEYLMQETTTGKYIQADGTLGATIVWQVLGTNSGQWGNGLGVHGKVRVTGLSSPVSQYIFKVKSRNPADSAHAVSSESAFSATAQVPNTAPSLILNSNLQTTDGTQYVPINYTATDGQGDISSLSLYEYSQDNTTWTQMTEKAGVSSNGVSNLIFLPTGSAFLFAWNSATDLPNVEDSTVYVRLRPNDSLVNGSTVTSAALEIDNKLPVVGSVTASQNSGARTVAVTYNLTDANNSLVELNVSSDGGSTWTVATSSVTGAVGANVVAGNGKTITWNAGVNFDDQYNTNMKLRVRARDTFGNQGSFAESSVFTVDTHDPSVTNASAVQDSGALTFVFSYDLLEDVGNVNVGLEISSDNGSSWSVPVTSATGAVGTGVASGNGKIITWNGAADYNNQEKTAMKFRLTATDSFSNAGILSSNGFSLDTKAPRVTSVTAGQVAGSTNVVFNYNLADQNNSLVELDISDDAGSTWTVADTSLVGDVGTGIVGATGKVITWNAGTDFDEQLKSGMRVRIRAKDVFNNQSADTVSSSFSLDTVNPVTNVTTDLQTQPNAGDVTVLVGGSFTETNPNTNVFFLDLNNTGYGAGTNGTVNTASPANQNTAVGAMLDGNDYISKVKITHTDDFGQSVDNENVAPSASLKYVKPYTPAAPTAENPGVGTVDVTINKNSAEVDGLEYAIFETSQSKYVQANGTLGDSPVWQVLGTGSGQWGNGSGVSGKININGLATHSYLYQFKVKSRNTSDLSHAVSSESALSNGASSQNQSPRVSFTTINQTTDGSKYVTINYEGYDLEAESVNLTSHQYSTNGTSWVTMTEKSGVNSDGISGLSFGNSGSGILHDFMWDVEADLPNTQDDTVFVKLQGNDGTSSGNLETSSAFVVDTKAPVVSSVSASQVSGSNNVLINYNLVDVSNSLVELQISEDAGLTWIVPATSVSGDVGNNITPGNSKAITWNAGVDFSNQEQNDLRVRVRATDTFSNIGSFTQSANFALDTKAPIVSAVTAVQNLGANTVAVTYSLLDANNSTVEIDISEDNGATWGVGDTSVIGNIGSGVTPGSKTFTWNAATDFPNRDQGNMKIRVRAFDVFGNLSSNSESSAFSVDTKAPVVTNVSGNQLLGSKFVSINYDLSDLSLVDVEIDLSGDGGSTWTVADTSISGDAGTGITQGNNKVIVWNAGVDYNNQDKSNMRVRVRGLDPYNNSSGDIESANFNVDTKAPVVASASDLSSQPNAGDTTATVSASFTESNPSINDFFVAINGGSYSATTTGDSNTASPSAQATLVGSTLDGNDYISKVKTVHYDKYNQSVVSENTSPALSFKYVKPYTPTSPIISNPQNTSVDVLVNMASGEADNLQYAIYEASTNKFVQANGTLGSSAVWQTLGLGAGNWGSASGVVGKITVSGLSSPVANYTFKVKSRNPADASHAVTSESSFSDASGISNTAPSLNIVSASQLAGTNYAVINYTGTDSQNDTNNLLVYEYSTDNIIWHTMIEKTAVGSSGISGLLFSSLGNNYSFAWDISADLPNTEDATVYVRLKSTDTLVESNVAASAAFAIDTLGPVASNINISQNPNSSIINIGYDLTDNSGGGVNVELLISDDNGLTYAVVAPSVSGDLGVGVSVGSGKNIIWNAGVDLPGVEVNQMKIKIRGTDVFGNLGNYTESSVFPLDTKGPVISSVSASQSNDSTSVNVNYTLADLSSSGNLVEFNVSQDGGATWQVTTSSVSGEIGNGQTTGSKTFIWNAGLNFSGEYQSDMKVRVRARDYFGNFGSFVNSSNFVLDTASPVISNINITQTPATENFVITYNLVENSGASTVDLQISADGGVTWSVGTSSVDGDVGNNITQGNNKTVTWNAGVDLNGQEKTNMRVRIKASDSLGNLGSFVSSADFVLDTGAPVGLASLSKFSSTASTLTLNWANGVTDSHFNHYELWYGAIESDVVNTTGTALKWSVTNDANLSNILTNSTVITGLNITDNFYVKIFAVDDYNNISSTAHVNVFTPVVTPEPAPVTAPVSGGGGGVVTSQIVKLSTPILTPVDSPTKNTQVIIKGIAPARTRVDLYDNGVFVARLNSVSSNDGLFSQTFSFNPGVHSLTVIAVDFNNNSSDRSLPVALEVTTLVPAAPIIFSPKNNDAVSNNEILIIGGAVASGVVEANLGGITYSAPVNTDGAWQLVLPNVNQLKNGLHSLTFRVVDLAGNLSPNTSLTLNKVERVVPAVTQPGISLVPGASGPTTGPVAINLAEPAIPPARLIEETAGAVELASLPIPKVTTAQAVVSVAKPNLIAFSGTSLPNQDVLVYIHSDQALVYRAHTNEAGIWSFAHDQSVTELTPGEHSIYAVAVDTGANVKSRPSALSFFTVEKSLWVTIYNLLNLPTTIVTVIILSVTIFWLYRLRKKGALAV